MATTRRKNRNDNPPSHGDDTFDVRKNLKKLRQGKTSYNSSKTESYHADSGEPNINSIKSEDAYSNSHQLGFTESMYNRYDKLKDELNTEVKDLKQEITDQGHGFKDDLNTKFQQLSREKLSINQFWRIVSGLTAFVIILGGVIYTLSLKDFNKDIKSNSGNIKIIEKGLDSINLKIEKQGQMLHELEQTTKEK